MFLLILPILQNSDSIHVYLNVINYECDSIIIWLYNLIPIITIEEVEKYIQVSLKNLPTLKTWAKTDFLEQSKLA